MSEAKRRYFGTDGVRGPYGGEVINEVFAARLGQAAARWAQGRGAAPGGLVLIGRDTRGSGPALVAAVAAGLRAGGLRPVSLGVAPTPAVARAVRRVCRSRVMLIAISASRRASTSARSDMRRC